MSVPPDAATGEFLAEAEEILDRIADDLADLERSAADGDPDPEAVNSIFRGAHSLKGIAGMCGLAHITEVSHKMETLLDGVRMGRVACTREVMDLLYETVDLLKGLCARLARGEAPEDPGVPGFVERLVSAAEGGEPAAPGVVETLGLAPDVLQVLTEYEVHRLEETVKNPRRALARVRATFPFESFDTDLEALNRALKSCGEIISTLPSPGGGASDRMDFDLLVGLKVDPEEARRAVEPFGAEVEVLAPAGAPAPEGDQGPLPEPAGPAPAACSVTGGAASDLRSLSRSIRVDLGKLDVLMNLVGELVLARNQLVQYAAGEREPAFVTTIQHLNQLTSELQEGVMKTRMQPIGNIWDKFPRIVRDLSMSLGKKVRMEMEGKETELDKTLIEAIKDPLTHIVRNSVDHGIETPEVRQQRGKDPEGRLYLRAYHEGGQVNVEISDDGGGIDPQKLLRKAIEKNVITPQQGSRMSERELVNLIFAPGFSTAEKVSNISGRGVGMDVVKTNIEKIGGTVDIQSTLGQGTTLRVKIPLTLAIVPALVVTCEQNRYCIPQVSLLELVRLDPEQPNGQRIETIQGTPVVRLRGNLLPLVYLRDELELPRRNLDREVVNIVVLQADARQFGLVVDGICDTEEIVVKPLGKQLGSLNAYAGTTIMGDGKVALILDIMGLAQKAGLVSSQSNGQASVSKEDSEDTSGSEGERQTLLVFRVGEHLRMAIALSMVARLEEIPVQSIEQSGNQLVVQYRGEIMPLFYLSRFFGQQDSSGDRESIQVVVYTDRGRSVGLVVDHILDIIEETIQIQPSGHSQCVLGKAVIQGRVTELLDVESLIQALDSQEFQDALAPARAV